MILITKAKNNSSDRHRKRLNPEYKFLILVSAALALAFICSFLLFRLTRVSGDSMSPTLSDGDFILVSSIPYKNATPKRGDVIVFQREAITKGHIVKRVIGLPNETVEIRGGRVFINGSAIDDDYFVFDEDDNFGPIVLTENGYFLLGDNRAESNDSRFWEKAEVEFEEIYGKMIFGFN